VLTNLFRRTAPPRYARHPVARNPLAFSSAAITAESAGASSAGSTRPSKFVLMSLHASIPTASCTEHATAVMALSESGNIFDPAAPTARAPAIAQRLSRLRHLLRQSVQKTLALAALPKAFRVPGTGAPSELAFAFLDCTEHSSAFSQHTIDSLMDDNPISYTFWGRCALLKLTPTVSLTTSLVEAFMYLHISASCVIELAVFCIQNAIQRFLLPLQGT
jgi:hypothetical protein